MVNVLLVVVSKGIYQESVFSVDWFRVLVKSIFLERNLFSNGMSVIEEVVIIVRVVVQGMYFYSLFNLCIFCVFDLWLIMLAVINKEVLNIVWLIIWNMAVMVVSCVFKLNSSVISFRWLIVEQVNKFFRLCLNRVIQVFNNMVVILVSDIVINQVLVLVSIG